MDLADWSCVVVLAREVTSTSGRTHPTSPSFWHASIREYMTAKSAFSFLLAILMVIVDILGGRWWCLHPPTSVSKNSTRTLTISNGAKGSIWFWAIRVAGGRHLTCASCSKEMVLLKCVCVSLKRSATCQSLFEIIYATRDLTNALLSTKVVLKKGTDRIKRQVKLCIFRNK